MLRLRICQFYRVKHGQTLKEIAKAFCVAESLLAQENRLTGEPFAGQILSIPAQRGNAYTAKEGESKALLCGSDEGYKEKNGTDILYPGMRVIL
jgi:hypothetical protein